LPDIVISEFMDQTAVDSASSDYDIHYDPGLVDNVDRLKELLKDARALVVRNRTRVRRGVEVCPATGANDDSVAEWVIVAVMTLLRGAFLSGAEILDGRWPRAKCIGRETGGKTLGLIGFGAIARKTAARAASLGMKVVAHDPFVAAGDPAWDFVSRMESLEALLDAADAVSVHVPLTDDTRHLIDAEAMAKMKKGAVLINSARGGVVDERAMVEALSTGHLGGAGMDVYETEPLTRGAAENFAGLDNLLLTPHIGGVTLESNVRVSKVTMENVRRVLERK
jgi:(S)-sulfolactate dehydrogenase